MLVRGSTCGLVCVLSTLVFCVLGLLSKQMPVSSPSAAASQLSAGKGEAAQGVGQTNSPALVCL
eukprot:scaffold70227_cov21-Tisochrysis_lutea.AAC.1